MSIITTTKQSPFVRWPNPRPVRGQHPVLMDPPPCPFCTGVHLGICRGVLPK